MWYDDLKPGYPWNALWYGYILCGCGGIRKDKGSCPRCGAVLPDDPWLIVPDEKSGQEMRLVRAYAGAEGRYEDWVYLRMIEQEWKRPLTEADEFKDISGPDRPSARAAIVIVFWSYFETRIDRLLRQSMINLPPAITKELLNRFPTIGSRLDRLYNLLFSTSYWTDLEDLGFEPIAKLLVRLQERRNDFAHGHPEAIDDMLIQDLIEGLKDEHESWIAAFNKRVPIRS
jgi:hypothetical protein